MGAMNIWHWLIVLSVVVLLFGSRKRMRPGESPWWRTQKVTSRVPIYSAETTNGSEAEFIRDRLPSRFPVVVAVALAAFVVVVAWWVS
jgi:hypothetical protein